MFNIPALFWSSGFY